MKSLVLKIVFKIYNRLLNSYEKYNYNNFRSKYDIDKNFKFNGNNIKFYGDGKISIKENTYIGGYSHLQTYKNCQINIGRNCTISHNVKIYTVSYLFKNNFDNTEKLHRTGNVNIGNGVFIGLNVYIGPNVTIGNNVVIGANTVITENIPDNTIVKAQIQTMIRNV